MWNLVTKPATDFQAEPSSAALRALGQWIGTLRASRNRTFVLGGPEGMGGEPASLGSTSGHCWVWILGFSAEIPRKALIVSLTAPQSWLLWCR